MQKGIHKILLCGFLLSGLSNGLMGQFRFNTQVSSSKVGVNQPFQLNFVLENATQLSGFQPPAFNGFNVLQQTQSNSMNDINGQVSQSMTYSYLLQPMSIGTFTIAGATARESGNPVTSNPVTIQVVQGTPQNSSGSTANTGGSPWAPSPGEAEPGGAGSSSDKLKKGQDPMALIRKNLFARAEVDKTTVYVGQQITATYKLYTRLHASSQVTKVPSFTGFSSHDIDLPNPIQAKVGKLGGETYNVFTIRKTMLFPLQAGTLELDPVEIQNDVRLYRMNKSSGNNNDPFASLFNDPAFKDPFGNDPFGNPDVSYQDFNYNASSPPVMITVKPLPAGQPAGFAGAVGHFTVNASLDKTSLSTDDAATLTLSVSGIGNIDMISAPKIDFPADFDSYDPKITDHFNKNANPFSGIRTFEYVFMPKSAGNFEIAPVSFSYFDPDAGKYETVSTPPFRIKVTPGSLSPGTGLSDYTHGSGGMLQPLLRGKLAWTQGDLLLVGTWWFWALMILPVLLLILAVMIRNKQQKLKADTVLLKHRRANRIALRRLSVAAGYLKGQEDKAFYDETSRAIWGYLSHKLDIPYGSLSRERVRESLKEAGINGTHTERLFALTDDCEVALYAPAGGQARMKQTYQDALEIIGNLETQLRR